jgi:hypothetical protein
MILCLDHDRTMDYGDPCPECETERGSASPMDDVELPFADADATPGNPASGRSASDAARLVLFPDNGTTRTPPCSTQKP